MSLKFDDTHYVPILKGKQGELDAIQETPSKIRGAFTPLLEIPPIPLKYVAGEDEPIPAKSIDDHVADMAEKLAEAVGTHSPVFIDGFYVEEEENLADGSEPIAGLLSVLREKGVQFIPTTGLDRAKEYGEAMKTAIEDDGRGCCLRLWEPDLESLADLESQIKSLLRFLAVDESDVDLLVDFGPDVPARSALPYQIKALPMLKKWRTLTLASSSFPMNMESIAQNSIAELEREEWLAWMFLRSKKQSLMRMPTFSDYAINHPELSEVDPRVMRMSPNIRYTVEVNYVVAKGKAYPRKAEGKKPGLAASDQYPKLAQAIMRHPNWAGKKFSWGDGFIEACSRKACVGSATNWRAVGTCHHIAFVVQQLASLP